MNMLPFPSLRPGVPNAGLSYAAIQRREWRDRGRLHVAGHPGEVIRMADNTKSGYREYVVQNDGSFRRKAA